MKGIRYTDEFKAEEIKQVTDCGYGVVEVSKRLGILNKSLYQWLRASKLQQQSDLSKDAAGPSLGGCAIVAIYDSKANWQKFLNGTLLPSIRSQVKG